MKLKAIQTFTAITLALGAFSLEPASAKVGQDEMLARILEVARDWKKAYKFDSKAQASLDNHLGLINDTERLMVRAEIDADSHRLILSGYPRIPKDALGNERYLI